MYAVYVATTPNPTGGYVVFVDEADVDILPMSVEDGLKLVISMGLVFPDKPLDKPLANPVAQAATAPVVADAKRPRRPAKAVRKKAR